MFLPFFIQPPALVEPPALVALAQEYHINVNTQGQVRNTFQIQFSWGLTNFRAGTHIWVESKIMRDGQQVGWVCSFRGQTFRVSLGNVQI